MNLSETVALVTGGASGLGEATARRFVAAGAHVVVVDLNDERGSALASELSGKVTYVKGNVADADDIARAVAAAEAVGPLRVAVSCAGVGVAMKVVGRENEPHDLAALEVDRRINRQTRAAQGAHSKNRARKPKPTAWLFSG